MFGNSKTYLPVAGNEEETIACTERPSTHLPHDRQPGRSLRLCWRIYQTLLHLLVFFLLGNFGIRWLRGGSQRCPNSLGSELPFLRDDIGHVDVVFTPSGFTESKESPSPYFGVPTPEKDKLWEELYKVGMVVITKEEHQQLNVETTHLVGDDDNYLVTIEVFHQLHCLDYLRHVSYAFTSGQKTHHADESDWSKTRHVDHCIDYLRQVLTCHGDLTPITLQTIPGVPALPWPNPPPYKANFNISHTCRNFDEIYDFALQRNTSGYKVA